MKITREELFESAIEATKVHNETCEGLLVNVDEQALDVLATARAFADEVREVSEQEA